MYVCVRQLSIRILEEIVLKEERFVLTDDFRAFGPWAIGSIAFKLVVRGKTEHHGAGLQECDQGRGTAPPPGVSNTGV